MPVFEYTASDKSGSIHKGKVEAVSKAAASGALLARGLFLLELDKCSERPPQTEVSLSQTEQIRETATAPVVPQGLPKRLEQPAQKAPKLKTRARFSPVQKALYLRQLHVLFGAGVPIHEAAEIVGSSREYSDRLQAKLRQVPSDLARGRLLSKSLERTGLFGKLVTASVRLGEESGRLHEILRALADSKEKSVRLRRTLISRLTYPCVVLAVMSTGLIVLGHVMSRVLASLPTRQKSNHAMFEFIQAFFAHPLFLPIVLGLLFALTALLRSGWKNPDLRLIGEQKLFRIPVLGALLKRLEANTITSQLSLLLSAGIPIIRCMELCADLVWTESFRRALLEARQALIDGYDLTQCFQQARLFPSDVLALLSAGEMSGTLEKSLSKASDYCSDQVERTLETALSLVEPLLVGLLGVIIGTILLCTFVPIFNSLQTL